MINFLKHWLSKKPLPAICVLVLLTLPGTSMADVTLSFSGMAMDTDGNPVESPWIKAVICDENGESVWSIDGLSNNCTQPTSAVQILSENGFFNIAMGDTTIDGMPSIADEIITAGGDLTLHVWMATSEDGSYEKIGTVPLISVPDATNAQYLQGNSAADFVRWDQNIPASKIDTDLLPGQLTIFPTSDRAMVLGNTVAAQNVGIQANVTAAATKPEIRFNTATASWQFSNDGTSFSDVSAGGVADQSQAYNWTNIHTWTGTMTNSGSALNISGTLGNDGDIDAVAGLNFNMTSANTGDADFVYALSVGGLNAANNLVTESAMRIGTGWDNLFEFEGSALDANQTFLQVTNPTADRTITLPNATGTVALTSGFNVNIQASTFAVNGTNTNDAIAGNLAPVWFSVTETGTDGDNTSAAIFMNGDGNTTLPQLIDVWNSDNNNAVANGITVRSYAGGMTDGIDASDANVTNALNAGDNPIIGTNLTLSGSTKLTMTIPDNIANAFELSEGVNTYLSFTTTNAGETLGFGGDNSDQNYLFYGNAAGRSVSPNAADLLDLGTNANEWNQLFLGDNAGIQFGIGQNAQMYYNTIKSSMILEGPNANLFVEDKIINNENMINIADNAVGALNTPYTLNAATNYVLLNCLDPDGCDITMDEASALTGTHLTIVNNGVNVCNFADTGGVSELAGGFGMGQFDSLEMIYIGHRWVETSRSNN